MGAGRIIAVGLAVLLSGCGAPVEAAGGISLAAGVYLGQSAPFPQAVLLSARRADSGVRLGKGKFLHAKGVRHLSEEQQKLMLDYVHAYYASLCKLSVQDVTHLFSSDAESDASGNMGVWDLEVRVRKMQKSDLTLDTYSFQLTCTSVAAEDNGDLTVRLSENNVQNFAAYPGVDSEVFGLGHGFTLTKTGDGWRIRKHWQYSGANNVLLGRSYGQSSSSYQAISRSEYIGQAKKDVAGRDTQGSKTGTVTADNAYNRKAAVAYAKKWVGQRNTPTYRSYDRAGGNCQNFVSQALWAGGIPMDYTSPGVWKWFGDTPDTQATASGRSPSWTAVGSFLTYAKTNSGYGLVARVDAPFYSGEIGDVIHMGTHQGYRHTVMISQVMKDDRGDVVDYLICSNTADMRNFPVSAYHYTNQTLIKIYGWNDA